MRIRASKDMGRWSVILFFGILMACASKRIISSSVSKDRLFPLGKYRHQISLTLPATQGAEQKHYEFSGVVSLEAEAIHIVALSPFGTTVFKIDDQLKSGEIRDEIYVAQMKKFEPKLLEYYSVLKHLLLTPSRPNRSDHQLSWKSQDSQGRPLEIETEGLEKNADFHFIKYDQNGVPEQIELNHPSFQAVIQVSSYEI